MKKYAITYGYNASEQKKSKKKYIYIADWSSFTERCERFTYQKYCLLEKKKKTKKIRRTSRAGSPAGRI